jgi:hypothetical protein
MLPTAELNLAYYYGGDISRFTGLLTQQMLGAANQWATFQNYAFSDPDFGNSWRALYTTTLNSLIRMEEYAQEKGYKHYQGIAKILSAYTFAVLVDMWGDVPFFEALKGSALLQPKFDDGAVIYAELHKRLADGIALLESEDNSAATPGSDDVMFGGNTDLWIRFAHATKARLYLHTVKYATDDTQKALDELALANGVDAFVTIQNPNNAPAYQFQYNRYGDIEYLGTTMADWMIANEDSRINAYIDTTYNEIGPLYGSPNSPVYLLSSVELAFMEAELLARNNSPAAQSVYEQAVLMSFQHAGDTAGYAKALELFPYNAAEANVMLRIKPIMEQKYFAMFAQPEIFNDWRRTGYPELTPVTGSAIPRRFLYPDTEKNTNKNTPTNLTIYDKVWWDKR